MFGQKKRSERVGELIHHELSQILIRKVADPRLAGLTVTKIKLSSDLRCAKIYVCLMGDEEKATNALEGLNKAKGFIRGELGRNIKLRYIPELIFKWDDSVDYGFHIDHIIDEIKNQ